MKQQVDALIEENKQLKRQQAELEDFKRQVARLVGSEQEERKPEKKTEKQKQREEAHNKSFRNFIDDRIIHSPGERSEFNRITRVFNHWAEWQGGIYRRPTTQELRKLCNTHFGEPEDGKLYRGIIVFDDEEAIEEYRRQNQ